MKAFLDTNIFVDLICHREPFAEEAKMIFALGMTHRVQLCVSALTIVNTIYIGRHYHIDQQELKSKIDGCNAYVNCLDISAYHIAESLKADWKDFEDAVQYHCAKDEEADCIVTRDKSGFDKSALTVYSPSEFLNLFSLSVPK